MMSSSGFQNHHTIGKEEISAALRVLEDGELSGFQGTWGPSFLGGSEIRLLESEWSDFFESQYAISVNSATSGLYAAMGAIGIGPGDEVIVTPLSMSASATAPLIYGAQPIFVDVSPDNFTLDPTDLLRAISPQTKAIIVVNLFGQAAELDTIIELAHQRNITVIEDNAQAPGALYKGLYTGTWGDIGIFSLNGHKHIQTGEGGICVTNNPELAERLQLIRNHAEAVTDSRDSLKNADLLGWNYRMTELTAAIGRCQLQKLPNIISKKISVAERLSRKIAHIEGLSIPTPYPDRNHVYYTFPLRLDETKLGISRTNFVKHLSERGIPIAERYVKPLYRQPLFQRNATENRAKLCTTADKLYDHELCYIPWCSYDFSDADADLIASSICHAIESKGEYNE